MTLSVAGTLTSTAAGMSQVQRTEHDQEHRIGDDHEKDRLNDRAWGLAADHGDDGCEHRRLADARQVRGRDDCLDEAIKELDEADAQLLARHDHAAQHAQHIREDRQQRQRDGQRDDLGQHQQFL